MDRKTSPVNIKVVGVGGAGGNAVLRMSKGRPEGVSFLALNTDVQALAQIKGLPTFAIGPKTTHGIGAGGDHEIGRKALRESQAQVAQMLEGADMVFVTAGMGGGTGTGAAPAVAEMSRRQGALTVGVVTLPFSFEGVHRKMVALEGIERLRQKVDTLIQVDNDRLLPALNGKASLEHAFQLADETLRQGVQGISDVVTAPGLINVDFADMRAIMSGAGAAFMAVGNGKGKHAAMDAAMSALSNPLFDAPLEGAQGVLFNIKGGKDLTLGQVHEVADAIRAASRSQPKVVFGVVQDRKLKNRVSITLVATGIETGEETGEELESDDPPDSGLLELVAKADSNGHNKLHAESTRKLF
ncbi:MAG: cell division protein FtsZ [Chloroflexi bacterium]|nr:cell division protein FtsZ [Chloroflexota bacterium]